MTTLHLEVETPPKNARTIPDVSILCDNNLVHLISSEPPWMSDRREDHSPESTPRALADAIGAREASLTAEQPVCVVRLRRPRETKPSAPTTPEEREMIEALLAEAAAISYYARAPSSATGAPAELAPDFQFFDTLIDAPAAVKAVEPAFSQHSDPPPRRDYDDAGDTGDDGGGGGGATGAGAMGSSREDQEGSALVSTRLMRPRRQAPAARLALSRTSRLSSSLRRRLTARQSSTSGHLSTAAGLPRGRFASYSAPLLTCATPRESATPSAPEALPLVARLPWGQASAWCARRANVSALESVCVLVAPAGARAGVRLARDPRSRQLLELRETRVRELVGHAGPGVGNSLAAADRFGDEASGTSVRQGVCQLATVARAWREREALAGLALHPFVATLHGSAADGGTLRLCLEPCLGGSLAALVARAPAALAAGPAPDGGSYPGALSERAAAFYVGALVLAIDAVHALGCVVRTLRPESLQLDAQGWPRLADLAHLGHVGAREEADHSHTPSGRTYTFFAPSLFMAPEVVRGESDGHGHEADWWSVGAILFALLVGRAPCESPREPAAAAGLEAGDATARTAEKLPMGRLCVGRVVWPRADEPPLSPHARELLADLLIASEHKRALRTSGAQIRAHAFFADNGICFDALLARAGVTPPWRPELSGAADVRFATEGAVALVSSPWLSAEACVNKYTVEYELDAGKWDAYFAGF
jgi:serine/threonine protein kinase